jgi:hypothetical protein
MRCYCDLGVAAVAVTPRKITANTLVVDITRKEAVTSAPRMAARCGLTATYEKETTTNKATEGSAG